MYWYVVYCMGLLAHWLLGAARQLAKTISVQATSDYGAHCARRAVQMIYEYLRTWYLRYYGGCTEA